MVPFIQISTFIFKITPSVVKGDRRERKGGAGREEERRRGEKEKREREIGEEERGLINVATSESGIQVAWSHLLIAYPIFSLLLDIHLKLI